VGQRLAQSCCLIVTAHFMGGAKREPHKAAPSLGRNTLSGKATEDPPWHGIAKQRNSRFTRFQVLKSLSPNTLSSVMRLGIPFTTLSLAQNAAKQMLAACIFTMR
jgi:hypothetical protein